MWTKSKLLNFQLLQLLNSGLTIDLYISILVLVSSSYPYVSLIGYDQSNTYKIDNREIIYTWDLEFDRHMGSLYAEGRGSPSCGKQAESYTALK